MVAGIRGLERAGPGDLSFLASGRYGELVAASRAGAIVTDSGLGTRYCSGKTVIVVADVRGSLTALLDALYPVPERHWGVSAYASIGAGARWSGRIEVGPQVVIADGVQFGDDCSVGTGTTIGEGVIVGNSVSIAPAAAIFSGVTIGDGAHIGPGSRIGTPGFGFIESGTGHTRIHHPAGCRIGNEVEIGANCTVDAGSVEPTEIGNRTKIDNLVHIGHNVAIGNDCIVLAQVGMAGSTVVEDRAVVGGQAGLSGHLTIGAGARIAAQSGVIGDVPAGATVSGYPARSHRDVLRETLALRELTARLAAIEEVTERSD